MSRLVVERLRAARHDVTWIAETDPGEHDPDVLALSVSQDRILLTEDHDFEVLAFGDLAPAVGIVRSAIGTALSEVDVAARICEVVDAFGDVRLRGRFTVIETHRTRQRDLPAVADLG